MWVIIFSIQLPVDFKAVTQPALPYYPQWRAFNAKSTDYTRVNGRKLQ